MKVYVLGNSEFLEDSIPIKFLSKLRKEIPNINFVEIDPSEDFPEEKHLFLLDTIINISGVKILDTGDLEKIETSPNYSLHDYDLGKQLKIMKKLGRIKEVTIIGIPPLSKFKKDQGKIFSEIVEKLNSLHE